MLPSNSDLTENSDCARHATSETNESQARKLSYVGDFLSTLQANVSTTPLDPNKVRVYWMVIDGVSLSLGPSDADHYHQTAARLVKDFGEGETLSDQYIGRLLRQAIGAVLGAMREHR